MAKLAESIPIWLFPFFSFFYDNVFAIGCIPSNRKGIPLAYLLMINFKYIAKPEVFFFFCTFDSHEKRLAILGPLTNLKTFLNRDIVIGHLP